MVEIKVIRSKAEFRKLDSIWNGLLERSDNNNIFLSWDWVLEWVEIYLAEDQLFCLIVYDDQKPAAIVPLWMDRRRFWGLFHLRVLCFLGSKELCPDHLDIIIRPRNHLPIIRAVWEYFFSTAGRQWDLLHMRDIPLNSPVLNEFFGLADSDDRCMKREIEEFSVCPFIELPGGWPEYLDSLSANQRRSFKISEKKIGDAGKLEFSICRNPDELKAEMDGLIDLNRRSWTKRGQPGSFTTRDFEEFHRRISAKLLEKDKLLLCSLTLEGRRVGSFYGFMYNRTAYYYVLGVEHDLVKGASIGRLLLGRCIEESIKRGCNEFDLLRGDEQYKYDWTSFERKNLFFAVYNRRPRSFLYLLYRFCGDYLKQIIKAILGKNYHAIKKMVLKS